MQIGIYLSDSDYDLARTLADLQGIPVTRLLRDAALACLRSGTPPAAQGDRRRAANRPAAQTATHTA